MLQAVLHVNYKETKLLNHMSEIIGQHRHFLSCVAIQHKQTEIKLLQLELLQKRDCVSTSLNY